MVIPSVDNCILLIIRWNNILLSCRSTCTTPAADLTFSPKGELDPKYAPAET
jgi:hypothetical protein